MLASLLFSWSRLGFSAAVKDGGSFGELPMLSLSPADAFMEELWFRGLFLRKFAPIIGEKASILVTAFVFTVAHAAAMYMNPSQAVLFQIILFPMALLFAYLMYKTDSVWGPTLYHAGSDVFLFYLMGW